MISGQCDEVMEDARLTRAVTLERLDLPIRLDRQLCLVITGIHQRLAIIS